MKINIIGDIAGRYDELIKLLEKMPEADLIISLGDMNDRGPQSKEVIEFFRTNPKARAVYGNHEDMLVNYMTGKGDYNGQYTFLHNGGGATLQSYKDENGDVMVDVGHIEFLEKLPMYIEFDDLILSHAPITSLKNIPTDPYGRDHYFIWNRYAPGKPQDKYMIHGHNGKHQVYKWGDGKDYGMCIDNSHNGELMGIHWPTKEIFVQQYREIEQYNALPMDEKEKMQKAAEEANERERKALRMLGY